MTSCHFNCSDTQAPNVSTCIVLVSSKNLWCHEERCTDGGVCLLILSDSQLSGHSEIGNLHFAAGVHQDVSTLEITMDQIARVQIVEAT